MAVILETERLILRTWTLDDAEEAFTIWSDPKVMRHIGDGRPVKDIEEARAWLRRLIRSQEENNFTRWAMVEKETGKLIGSCGFGYLYGGPEIELGYILARAYWGRGLATEAARACLRYGFEKLHLQKIVSTTDPEHTASQRVLEKIGFQYVGLKVYEDGMAALYRLRPER